MSEENKNKPVADANKKMPAVDVNKKFNPVVRYAVGVKGPYGKNANSFNKAYPSFVVSGQHFLDLGCPDTYTYFKKNPENLPIDQVYTICTLNSQNVATYFDSMNPQSPTQTSFGKLEQPVPPVQSNEELLRLQKEVLEQKLREADQRAIENKLNATIEQKDELIKSLNVQIEDFRNNGTLEAARLAKSVEEKDATIANLYEQLDTLRKDMTTKVDELTQTSNMHELEKTKALSGLEEFQKKTKEDAEALKLHQTRLREIERKEADAEAAGLSGLAEVGLGALGEFAKSPLIQAGLANLMNGWAKKMGMEIPQLAVPAPVLPAAYGQPAPAFNQNIMPPVATGGYDPSKYEPQREMENG
jgi:hypothetical protein